MAQEVKSIDIKLFELQKVVEKVKKDKDNPYHKSIYFDINGLLDVVKPHLISNNLLLKQPIIENKVYTTLVDMDSGETESCYLELHQNDNPQKVGSEITYYRRYTLQSLLALIAEDDDGNNASGNKTEKQKEQEEEDKKPWLNETTKDSSEPTKLWLKITKAIEEGRVTSLKQLRDHYKVSKTEGAKLEKLLNK